MNGVYCSARYTVPGRPPRKHPFSAHAWVLPENITHLGEEAPHLIIFHWRMDDDRKQTVSEAARREYEELDALNRRDAVRLGWMKSVDGPTLLDKVRMRWKSHKADYFRLIAAVFIIGSFLVWMLS